MSVLACVYGGTVPQGAVIHQVHQLAEAEPPAPGRLSLLSDAEDSNAGVLYFAGEATDVLDPQQVHGAMRSGMRAAKQIISRMADETREAQAASDDATAAAPSSRMQ